MSEVLLRGMALTRRWGLNLPRAELARAASATLATDGAVMGLAQTQQVVARLCLGLDDGSARIGEGNPDHAGIPCAAAAAFIKAAASSISPTVV